MEPLDEPLEEPLFLDGIIIRRWSDLALLPRPRDTSPEPTNPWTDPDPDPVPPMP